MTILALRQGLALLAWAAAASDADALGLAGGDRSLATVAAAAARRERPLIYVPAGSRSHFALDVGSIGATPQALLAALSHSEPQVCQKPPPAPEAR